MSGRERARVFLHKAQLLMQNKYFHMKVICQRCSWINIHINAISYYIRGDLFFLICVTNLWWKEMGKMSTSPHGFMFWGMVKNAAGPGGQGLNLCLFLVKSHFLVGGSGVPWHFLCWGILFIWPKDSAQSHQPTAAKHTGLRDKGPGETRIRLLLDGLAWMWHFLLIHLFLFKWLIFDQNREFQPRGHLVISGISARRPSKCFDMSLQGFWWKGQWHTVTIPPLLQRVTSPRQHTSHTDQWHNSCQGPSVLMSHTSQQFYFKLPPLSLPLLSFTPSPLLVPSLLSCTASLSLSTSSPPFTSLFIISLTLISLSVWLSVYLSLPLSRIMPCINPFASPLPALSPCLSPVLCPPCPTYAQTGIPSRSRCRSCPLHVVWGWTFEESCRHLSLSPALILNTAANPPQIPSARLAHWPLRRR